MNESDVDAASPAPTVIPGAEQALGRLEQALAVAADLSGMTESLAQACTWIGLVGWALILYQEDGTHLFPCSMAGLDPSWEPPLRLLSTTESWPVTLAALGQEGRGCDSTGPYPLPGMGPRAWSALPLPKGQGVLVALRPGITPFSEPEHEFLRRAGQLAGRYLPQMMSTAVAPVPAPSMRSLQQGSFYLDLATDSLQVDDVFAQLHELPGSGRYPLAQVLEALPAADLPDVRHLLDTLHTRHGTYEVSYRLAHPADRPRQLQARCTTTGNPADPPALLVGHVTDTTEATARATQREELLREQLRRADRMIALASSAASATGTAELASAACEALAVFGADALLLAEAHQGRTRILTTVGHDEEQIAAVAGVALDARTPLTDALREQEPVFSPSHEDLVAAYPHYAAALPRLQRHAWAALPLPLAHSSTRAACMFSFNRPHAFGPSDQALLVAAAALLGRALDRCRDYDTEHARAIELQHGLLPAFLPEHPRLELAASYHPAAPGAHAGGDWYDAFPLPDGRIALVIGDAEGHHTKAAILMGRLRTTIRAYAATTSDPAAILHRTNRLLTRDNDAAPDGALLATCCIVALDPHTGRIDCATAAHPGPLLLTGRRPTLIPSPEPALEPAPGLPLGILPDADYPTTRLTLPPGGRLLLHTDGLTDSPGTDPDAARHRLRTALTDTADDPPALALHQITTTCLPTPTPHDDSALLLAHRTAG